MISQFYFLYLATKQPFMKYKKRNSSYLSSSYCGRNTFILSAAILFLIIPSCSSLSKNQIKTVETFAASCDSFTAYPSMLFREMSVLRVERGIYFASTLTTPDLRLGELNEIYYESGKDTALAKKLDLSMKILQRYSHALKSLSHQNRVNDAGREFRSLGRSLDSLVYTFNGLKLIKPLPTSLLGLSGRIIGYGAELILSNSRSKALRIYITEGDTLVSSLCDNLSSLLTGPEVKAIIENEQQGLKANYLSYLRSKGSDAEISEDRRYISMLEKAYKIDKIRKGSSSAVNALRRAHNKLAKDVTRKKKFTEIYDEITAFNQEVEKLAKATKTKLSAL
ncbi:MAG TPA: hypothetical protein DEG92_07670 [Rikenellaceae bacterium]|nr:hypothetical protein [Rikenellaceae bacterium]